MVVYKITKNSRGMGGLMCPPGHPNLTYVVEEYSSARSKDPSGMFSLDSVRDQDGFPGNIRNQVQKIMDEATLIQSENWIRWVYGYFENMSELICSPTPVPGLMHAATARIRDFFPDHQPRMDLIENPGKGYGAYPCTKCGSRVQYEARLDAHAVFGMDESGADCPKGGGHHVED